MDEDDVETTLGRFGLSVYESRVFIALQKLGTGTASEVADVTDVPRSQVYGAAEALAERGLVEIQQSTPIRYRPVSPTEAEDRLTDRFAEQRTQAFTYLSDVAGSMSQDGERRAEVWTVDGRDNVSERVRTLAADARQRLVFGTRNPSFLDEDLQLTLADRARAGVEVIVTSSNPTVLEQVPDGVDAKTASTELDPGEQSTRVLVVDGSAVLLGVWTDQGGETAVWSEGTGFATVLARLVRGVLGDLLE